jgi:hypothetical protein
MGSSVHARCPIAVVTLGPSLPAAEARRLFPAAQVRPPVAGGEVLGWGLRSGDTLLVIDGLFLQSRAVRHKELLFLLESGVTVLGASSMGALRAAELHEYGMRGIGRVFRAYRDQDITGDDEVALLHSDAESGYRVLGWAMVDLRDAVADARAKGILSQADAETVVEAAAALPFTARHAASILAAARERGACPESLDRFKTKCSPGAGWVKSRDAKLALRMTARLHTSRVAEADLDGTARKTDDRGAQAGPASGGRLRYLDKPCPLATTSFLRSWMPVPGWSTATTSAYAAFAHMATTDPRFPDVFRRVAAECLLLSANGIHDITQVDHGRVFLATRFGLTAENGLLPWDGLVARLYALLGNLGLPDTVPESAWRLLRATERENTPAQAAVLFATRIWRADPRFDWLTPLLARIAPLRSAPGPAGHDDPPRGGAPMSPRRVLASWGVQGNGEMLAALRERGLLDQVELLQAIRAVNQSMKLSTCSTSEGAVQ